MIHLLDKPHSGKNPWAMLPHLYCFLQLRLLLQLLPLPHHFFCLVLLPQHLLLALLPQRFLLVLLPQRLLLVLLPQHLLLPH